MRYISAEENIYFNSIFLTFLLIKLITFSDATAKRTYLTNCHS